MVQLRSFVIKNIFKIVSFYLNVEVLVSSAPTGSSWQDLSVTFIQLFIIGTSHF